MGKNKKVKLSSIDIDKSEMMSENAHDTHEPGMLSSKKKKKSRKGDRSLQPTLSSYVSTSSPMGKSQPNSNPTDGLKTKVSPKREHIQAPGNEYRFVEGNSVAALDNRKRKSNDTTDDRTSKKIRKEHKNVDTVGNTQSNSLRTNEAHSEDSASCSPDMSNTTRYKVQESILAPKSSLKKKVHHSNISSDEGVLHRNHLGGHLIEEEIEENRLEERQLHPAMDSKCDWTKEQTEELIFMIKERIGLVTAEDSMSYRCRVKTLPWKDLPSQLHPPRTEQECNDQLQHIVENTKTVRNLFEMLRAYRVKPIRNKVAVLNPLKRFMQDRVTEIKKLQGNFIMNAKKSFDALSEEERRQYTDPYNDEMAHKKALRSKPGRSTFQIFCANNPNLSAEEQKEKFSVLTPEQKLPLIKQALKEHKQKLKDFEALHGNDAHHKPPSNRLNKEEWRLFLENKGMPLMRAVSPYQLFLLDHDNTDAEAGVDDKIKTLRRYQNFARSKHYAEYELKFKQELNEFSSNFKAWFGNVKVELWKEPAHTYFTEMTTSKGGVKKTKFNFKVTSKVQELEQSYVESTMIAKFSDEPVPAPMTARDVFKQFAKAKNPKVALNELNDTWNNLAQTHKEKFTEVAINNVKEYKAKLKRYVTGLTDHERRVYIGQTRVRYIRVFEGTDIFEKNYPCSDYPPFRIPGRNEKKASTNKANQSKVNLDFDSMLKTSSTTNGENEESGSEEQDPPNNEKTLSEESFKGRLPSTSTPGTVAKKGTSAAKQVTVSINNDQEESDSGSSESDDDDNSDGENSTQYLDAVQKVHPKKLLEVYSESNSEESSEDEEESPKPSHPAKAGRLPVPVQATPKQPVTSATGGDSSSSEEETSSSSSDENARVATMNKSLNKASQQTVKASPHAVRASPHAVKASPHAVKASPHAVKASPHAVKASPHAVKASPQYSTKTAQQHLSPKKQMATSNKTATPSSKLFQQTSKVAAQRQAESTSSDSSDSEEESPPKKKTTVKSASSRITPSLPPPKYDSSSEDEEEEVGTAWS